MGYETFWRGRRVQLINPRTHGKIQSGGGVCQDPFLAFFGRWVYGGFDMGRPSKNDATETSTARRLSIPLDTDGSIDWSGMRPSTRNRILDELGPDIASKLIAHNGGGDDPGMASSGVSITPANVRTALDLVSSANALLFSTIAPYLLKHPLKRDPQTGKPLPLTIDKDIALNAFKLTDAQHEELDPRAAVIAERYAGRMPDWLKKNFDVYVLGVMFLRFQAENAKNAITGQLTRDVTNFRKMQTSPPADSDQPVNGKDRTDENVHTSGSIRITDEEKTESFEPGAEPDGGL